MRTQKTKQRNSKYAFLKSRNQKFTYKKKKKTITYAIRITKNMKF